jgi:hypothetical protein
MNNDLVLKCTLDEALTMMTPRLRIEETALNAAACLLDRLRFGLEDEDGTRKLLRAIITLMPCPPHPTVHEQLLEILPTLKHPQPVIEELAELTGSTLDQGTLRVIVETYKKVLSLDGSLIVPIVGSLFKLPLSGATMNEAASIAREALSVVDDDDIPTVVRTLMKTLDQSTNSAAAVHGIRKEAGGLSDHALVRSLFNIITCSEVLTS